MVFQCINIRQVPWEVLKTEAFGLGFQHLPRDLANVNAWKPCLILILKNISPHIGGSDQTGHWLILAFAVAILAVFCFHNTYHVMDKFSRRQTDDIFFYFVLLEKLVLTLQSYSLLMKNKKNILKCRLLNFLPSMQIVKWLLIGNYSPPVMRNCNAIPNQLFQSSRPKQA